jgi:hypothetical protein
MTNRCTSQVASLALVLVALMPAAGAAQGRPFARLDVAIGQGYDDNVFASPSSGNPQQDFITRFGPILETGYQSPALSLLARYGFDAERYVELTELDNNLARQEARLDFGYRPVPRLGFQIDGSYLDTQSPRELNTATLVPAGRARAQRLRGHSELSYDATALLKVGTEYEYAEDVIEGSGETQTQTARVGLSYRPTPRSTYRTDYRYSYLEFSDGSTLPTMAVTVGWARVITPLLTLEIDAGPRLSNGEIRPELAALLRRRLRRGEVTIAYHTTEDTTVGEVGTILVRRLMGTVSYSPWRAVTLRAAPAAVHNRRDSSPLVTVYEVDGDVTFRVNPTLSFVAAGHVGQQNGNFLGSPDVIPYRGISIKTVVTLQ